ncbi:MULTISPECIES: class F sortase [Streptomyces]|uniref:class F sortase n=1 Tax=Streptomyces TaxID=1883 RepID=UPI001674ADBB|nr:class F sortase [Streptomyces galilaeus]GGW61268.1 class F sortase [Streptomyces galilaeus]
MAPGHQTRASSPSYVPSVKLVAWTLLTGALLVSGALHEVRPPQPSTDQALSSPVAPAVAPTAAAATGPGVEPLRPAPPLRLRIPVIGVDAPMSSLDLDAAGALLPPPADNPRLVGWYGGGTSPGSVGTAVTTGHVDLPTGGPGVFYGLGSVAKGNTVEIDRADGRTAVFTVDAVEVYDKERFPDDKVYGGSDRAELRVITCGGGYTKSTGYRSNVVVYASLAAVR